MRELRPLTPDAVGDLVGSCAPCTFWQTVPRNGHQDHTDPLALLADWVAEVEGDWGVPGRVAYVDGVVAGHVLMVPARYVPRLAAFPTAPADPGTLMLLTATTSEAHAANGLRKALVQSAAKDALRHRARSIDVVAARSTVVGKHDCVLDVDVVRKVGFRVERDHPAYPRLRIDLRTILTVTDEAAAFVSRALARIPGVRPVPGTHPHGSSHARTRD